jgi:phosphatidylinositol-3,4,5-trisphosphate 3-phosphatase/dual-specificity protein phosphatase PTEN
MASALRGLVSKKKRRFQQDGFDLDLTYVTERVIAMGFPSKGAEAAYRNPLPEVQRFFETRHADHYKIYNLCAERAYEIDAFFGRVERFPFNDHNPCPLTMMEAFCKSVDEWLAADPANVVAVHCKAGKGRTGLMIACYLEHCRLCATADEALDYFGEKRTANAKGVTIPSQMRYVHYYGQILSKGYPTIQTYLVTHIRFITVPNFDVGGGCDPYFHVKCDDRKVYDYRKFMKKIRHFKKDERFVDLDCSTHNLRIRGDVKMIFFDWDQYSSDDKMFHFWFNTGYIENNYLCFEKSVIDKACKDKGNRKFDSNFKVEIFLHKVEGEVELAEVDGEAEPHDTDTEDEEED